MDLLPFCGKTILAVFVVFAILNGLSAILHHLEEKAAKTPGVEDDARLARIRVVLNFMIKVLDYVIAKGTVKK